MSEGLHINIDSSSAKGQRAGALARELYTTWAELRIGDPSLVEATAPPIVGELLDDFELLVLVLYAQAALARRAVTMAAGLSFGTVEEAQAADAAELFTALAKTLDTVMSRHREDPFA